MPSHRLLVRGGYVRQLGAGLYSLLPLGFRVAKRVEQVIREEMEAIGGQELSMPVVHPADLWRETGRWDSIGAEMARFQDRAGRDMVLAMTHEEVVADLLRDLVSSYRQLPVMLYHFQTKFRDEPRSRGGLICVREFVMKDSYSCDLDEAGLDEEHTFTTMMRTSDLAPLVDLSGGVQLADREGVWAHSFKCRACTLHFVLFSWSASRHTPETIACPECGGTGGFLHRITKLSASRTFSLAPDREPEIYDVWPFRLPGDGENRA